jgi:predicted nucleic acid-binding protein
LTARPEQVIVLDACVVINLWASRRFDEILATSGFRAVIAVQAAAEAVWIEDELGQRERIPTDDLAASGRVEIWTPIDDELEVLLELAASLGDGEAGSLAVAHGRRLPVATDDRPARRAARGLSPQVTLRSTSQLMRAWAVERAPTEVAQVLERIEIGAKFQPPQRDPDAPWWTTSRRGRRP